MQLVSHGTPESHSPLINVENIDAVVNIAYGFDSSPLAVKTIVANLSTLFTYLQ